jgi:hypothetical protein
MNSRTKTFYSGAMSNIQINPGSGEPMAVKYIAIYLASKSNEQ